MDSLISEQNLTLLGYSLSPLEMAIEESSE